MNKLTNQPPEAHTTHGGTNDTPRAMDDKLNQLCKDLGLKKGRILEAVGFYPARYASKLRYKQGLTDSERLSINSVMDDLAQKAVNYAQMLENAPSHYEIVESCIDDLGITRRSVIELLGVGPNFFHDAFKRNKILDPTSVSRLKEALLKISCELKNSSI